MIKEILAFEMDLDLEVSISSLMCPSGGPMCPKGVAH